MQPTLNFRQWVPLKATFFHPDGRIDLCPEEMKYVQLQQQWCDPSTGLTEWRNVPLVFESNLERFKSNPDQKDTRP